MWFDALILCTLAFAIIRGAMKGIVWQLAVIGSLVFCFAFAGTLSLAVAPHIGVKPPLNRWIAMFIIYAVFSFVAFGVARLVRDWIEAVRFVDYDRHLGAVLGFVKGTIFCLVLTFFSVTLSEDLRGQVMASQSGRLAAIVMDRLHPVMPDELHDVLEPYIHQLDQPGLDLQHAHHDHDHGDDDDHDHAHHRRSDRAVHQRGKRGRSRRLARQASPDARRRPAVDGAAGLRANRSPRPPGAARQASLRRPLADADHRRGMAERQAGRPRSRSRAAPAHAQ